MLTQICVVNVESMLTSHQWGSVAFKWELNIELMALVNQCIHTNSIKLLNACKEMVNRVLIAYRYKVQIHWVHMFISHKHITFNAFVVWAFQVLIKLLNFCKKWLKGFWLPTDKSKDTLSAHVYFVLLFCFVKTSTIRLIREPTSVHGSFYWQSINNHCWWLLIINADVFIWKFIEIQYNCEACGQKSWLLF